MFFQKALFISVVSAVVVFSGCSKSNDNTPPSRPPPGGTEPAPANVNPVTYAKFKPVLDTGVRALAWLKLVNQNRDLQNRLNLADRNTKNPVPPEKPNVTSIALILKKFDERIATLPPEMKASLLEQQSLTEIPPVADDVFIKKIREFNSLYQSAIRWMGSEQYFDDYYSKADQYDIRGYYFFMKEPKAVTDLTTFNDLAVDQKEKYTSWLISMCHNSGLTILNCQADLAPFIQNKNVDAFYKKYFSSAQNIYNEFFQIKKMREELKWNSDLSVLTQDFILPPLDKITQWLKTNVEEEWKSAGFQLLLNFIPQNKTAPFIEFVKGVTPHVSGDTWNKITMDPDYSLDDYDTQWTIRHEFGHILGFPDCYLEFYDSAKEEMIFYTIEPDNLMCAWGGKLQPSHIEQLRQAYK